MRCCPDIASLTRRQWLAGATGLGALAALQQSGYADIGSAGATARNTARAVILVNLIGAPSHIDTFDAKDAPWNPADANLQPGAGGIVLSRALFPGLLGLSSDLLLLRSVQSWEAAHERGQFYLQTAHPANPAFVAETPNMGSVVALEKGGSGLLPPFLALNGSPTQGAKFLGGKDEPMSAPSNPGGLSTLQHNFFGNASQARFESQYKLLLDLDGGLRAAPYDQVMANHADYYTAAKALMYQPTIIQIFQFNDTDNQRYGNSNFGRACIVARNAIQAKQGTVFVSINHGNWDLHQHMFDRAYVPNMYQLCNDLDNGIANLAADLKASGDLSQTLIVMLGEFGRTPGDLNPQGGRDHHKDAMCVAMLGGGVKGGRVIGATDSTGDQVVDFGWSQNRVIFMEDIASTIYSALGIDWTKSILDTPSGRKFEYVPFAANGAYLPIDEVFG
ncbi:MAG TPA: DUF1501 domain-containing protein [Bryobacteraceae bacterium]|nr:DUF1501 domain-containing protein [Bryobacteraceae bacterium]